MQQCSPYLIPRRQLSTLIVFLTADVGDVDLDLGMPDALDMELNALDVDLEADAMVAEVMNVDDPNKVIEL